MQGALKDFSQGQLEPESNATQQSAQDELLDNVASMREVVKESQAAVLSGNHAKLGSSLGRMAAEVQYLVDAAEAVAVDSEEEATTQRCLDAGDECSVKTLAFAKVAWCHSIVFALAFLLSVRGLHRPASWD